MMFWLLAGVLAGILGAGAIYQTIGTRRGATRCAPPGESIDVGGQRLHLVRTGCGRPAVLFEAGIAASSLSWTRVMPAIAADVQACAYDRAGLGWSDPARAPRTIARMMTELRGVLAHTATPAVLVGHSFGAFLVLALRGARSRATSRGSSCSIRRPNGTTPRASARACSGAGSSCPVSAASWRASARSAAASRS